MRRISEFMTQSPHTIGAEQPLAHAHALMREHGIRHLPVLHGGRLVGIVSLRDLHLVETLANVDPEVVRVEDAMTTDLFVTDPDTPLTEVAAAMFERKLGSAVITHRNHILGVFTTVDALRILAAHDGA
jgi:acetoin utilization protein AcuB